MIRFLAAVSSLLKSWQNAAWTLSHRRLPGRMSIYRVTATKKGGVPVEVQRRKHNKTVTLLSLANVRGDHQLLLSHLKTALGTGGAIVDGAI